jgi:hypothetical protein
MTKIEQETLMQDCMRESVRAKDIDVQFDFKLDFMQVQFIIANMQLALRHPGNTGVCAEFARKLIAQLIDQVTQIGFPHTALMLELGSDPEEDLPNEDIPAVPPFACVKAVH